MKLVLFERQAQDVLLTVCNCRHFFL